MASIDISQLVQLTGVSSATLRYYEKKGLISPIGRKGLKRLYKPDIVTRLAFILLAKQNRFSLDEIKVLLSTLNMGMNRQSIGHKIEEIEHNIMQLQQLKDSLSHIKQCPADNHFHCPTFQTLLNNTFNQNQP